MFSPNDSLRYSQNPPSQVYNQQSHLLAGPHDFIIKFKLWGSSLEALYELRLG